MAVGDTVSYGAYNIADQATVDIQPASGVEVLVHTLEFEASKAVEIYRTSNGVNFSKIDTVPGGAMDGVVRRCTNTYWLRLKNVSGGAAGVYAHGVQTK